MIGRSGRGGFIAARYIISFFAKVELQMMDLRPGGGVRKTLRYLLNKRGG